MANTLDPIERFILEDLPQMQKLALTAALVDQTINEQERALHDFMADFADRLGDYYGRRVLGRDIERNGFTRQTVDHAKACGVQLRIVEREPARIIKFPTPNHRNAG